jgi:hypothetical protein
MVNHTKPLLQGFLLTATAISIFLTLTFLPSFTTVWLGLPVVCMLAAPFTINCMLLLNKASQKRSDKEVVKQVKAVLMGLQGFALACWFLDVLTTVFVLDVRSIGIEINPLGWPFGIIGAAVYYIPALIGGYFLLYKIKTKGSFYGAAGLTVLTLYMASNNLFAGINNFQNVMHYFEPGTRFAETMIFWLTAFITLSIMNIVWISKEHKKEKNPRYPPFEDVFGVSVFSGLMFVIRPFA